MSGAAADDRPSRPLRALYAYGPPLVVLAVAVVGVLPLLEFTGDGLTAISVYGLTVLAFVLVYAYAYRATLRARFA